MPESLPGKGFFGWLGRQVGHVKRAVARDVTVKTVYRNERVEEAEHPRSAGARFRRTVIDEVIVPAPTAPDDDRPTARR
jgi:hypothetical protein